MKVNDAAVGLDDPDGYIKVNGLAVLPEYRGQGLTLFMKPSDIRKLPSGFTRIMNK